MKWSGVMSGSRTNHSFEPVFLVNYRWTSSPNQKTVWSSSLLEQICSAAIELFPQPIYSLFAYAHLKVLTQLTASKVRLEMKGEQ